MEHLIFLRKMLGFLKRDKFFENEDPSLTEECINMKQQRYKLDEFDIEKVTDKTIKNFGDDTWDYDLDAFDLLENNVHRIEIEGQYNGTQKLLCGSVTKAFTPDNELQDDETKIKSQTECDKLNSDSKYISTYIDEFEFFADNESYWFDDERLEDNELYIGQSANNSFYIDEDDDILSKNIPSASPYDNMHWYVSYYELNSDDEDGCAGIKQNLEYKEDLIEPKISNYLEVVNKNKEEIETEKTLQDNKKSIERRNISQYTQSDGRDIRVHDLKARNDHDDESEEENVHKNYFSVKHLKAEGSAKTNQNAGRENEDVCECKELVTMETAEAVHIIEEDNETGNEVEAEVARHQYGFLFNIIKNILNRYHIN